MLCAGRLALVTGGGSGIGRKICQILAREGAQVVVLDQCLESSQETINTLSNLKNGKHLAVKADVTKITNVQLCFQEIVKKYSRTADLLVNNAGIIRDSYLIKMSEDDFDKVLEVNLKGTFLLTRTFANFLVDEGNVSGSRTVVNISSIVGQMGNIGQCNYSASKAAVVAFTKTSAKEFGRFGIRVNCVSPGMIQTSMIKAIPHNIQQMLLQQIPLSRFGTADEVAEAVVFLSSSRSSYINGAVLSVNGGLL